jgi:hypothetical protein
VTAVETIDGAALSRLLAAEPHALADPAAVWNAPRLFVLVTRHDDIKTVLQDNYDRFRGGASGPDSDRRGRCAPRSTTSMAGC